MAKKDFKRTMLAKYKKLASFIPIYNRITLAVFKEEQFQAVLIAALVKSFEFNFDLNRAKNVTNAFYNLSFLCGICEDLIALKFIGKLSSNDRNELIIAYNQYLLLSSVKSQTDFFRSVKPFQPIVHYGQAAMKLEDIEKVLMEFWSKRGHRKDKIFPGVEHMAVDSKLKLLYDYLYHATSKTVHFSPNILLRLGWYKSKDDPIVFSVKNFGHYYDIFNCYYGSYLFVEFCSAFKTHLNLNKDFLGIVKSIKATLADFDYFPELVTFEELNIKRPNNLPYKILELTSKMKKEEKESFVQQLPEIIDEVKRRVVKERSKITKRSR